MPRRTITRRYLAGLVGGVAVLALVAPALPAVADSRELFIRSATAVDTRTGTVTLPLFKGTSGGRTVWYVVTESSDESDARRRGVNAAPRLANAIGTKAVQRARVVHGTIDFPGTVDFSPKRVVVPGPTIFPPARFAPGAVGDAKYSPLVTTDGRIVLNASQVANGTGRHDAIVRINFAARRVTLDTFDGFYNGKRIQYLHQEGSAKLIAAIEGSTFAPNLNAAPGFPNTEARNSALEEIIPTVNGPRGRNNPQRQGLKSALLGQGDPLNITTAIPDDDDYSPMWGVFPGMWTRAAIRSGERELLTSESEVRNAVSHHELVSAGAGPRNEELEGLRILPGISNCPIVLQLGG